MSFIILLSILLFGAIYANAQSVADLPACALSCVTQFSSGSSIGSCSRADIACICSDKTFLRAIGCCLAATCNAADQQSSTDFAHSFCAVSGVTDLPDSVRDACPSSSSSSASKPTTTSRAAGPGNNEGTTTPPTSKKQSSTSSSKTISLTSESPSQQTSSPTPGANSLNKHKGLSTGAKAGIAIGVILLAIFAFLIVWFLIRRSKRKKKGLETHLPREAELETKANAHELQQKSDGDKPVMSHEVPINKAFQQYEDLGAPFEMSDNIKKPERDGNVNMNMVEIADTAVRRKELPISNKTGPIENIDRKIASHELLAEGNTAELQSEPLSAEKESHIIPQTVPYSLPEQPFPEQGSHVDQRSERSASSHSTAIADPAASIINRNPSRIEALKAQRANIRAEKERLTRLAELDEMEAKVQREILEEERRGV